MEEIPINYQNHSSLKLRNTLLTKLYSLYKIEYSHSKFQNKPFALPMVKEN